MNYTLIEQQQEEVWGNRKCFEFVEGRESLLTAFVDVTDVLFKAQFIVQSESEVFEALHQLNSFITDAGGVVGGAVGCAVYAGSVKEQFFCFHYIQLQVIVLGDGVLVAQNRVIVIKEFKYGSVIRVLEVCSDGCEADTVIGVEGIQEGAQDKALWGSGVGDGG